MPTIVFIHGFMENGHCFKQWKSFFEKEGYKAYNPTWINHEKEATDEEKAQTDFQAIIENYSHFIDTLDEKPILIGHSLGGILVQKLLELGKEAWRLPLPVDLHNPFLLGIKTGFYPISK